MVVGVARGSRVHDFSGSLMPFRYRHLPGLADLLSSKHVAIYAGPMPVSGSSDETRDQRRLTQQCRSTMTMHIQRLRPQYASCTPQLCDTPNGATGQRATRYAHVTLLRGSRGVVQARFAIRRASYQSESHPMM